MKPGIEVSSEVLQSIKNVANDLYIATGAIPNDQTIDKPWDELSASCWNTAVISYHNVHPSKLNGEQAYSLLVEH